MITGKRAVAWWLAVSGMASAELPGLNEKEWLGYFVGYENKKFHFGISGKGRGVIKPVVQKGELISKQLWVAVDFRVEETKPDGTTAVRAILPETLESAQPATNEPKKIVFKGKVKGGGSFEVFVDEEKGVIFLGGRLVDPGTAKNPLKFSIQADFPDAYPRVKKAGDKKAEDAFEERIKNDRLQLTWTDGKRVKPQTDKALDAASKEVTGPGISALQVEFSSFQERKIGLVAAANSTMALVNPQSAPLHEGFTAVWTADAVKDPEAKARLAIEVK